MSKWWASFKSWVANKFGRIVTALGVLLQGIDTLDITVIKAPLESVIGHKGVQATVVALFILSWLRHQYVASKHP